jgi:poly-gamma-glutamate capsule biosynthesis protein CapA/YwtB (metallophosphatase superfamily)
MNNKQILTTYKSKSSRLHASRARRARTRSIVRVVIAVVIVAGLGYAAVSVAPAAESWLGGVAKTLRADKNASSASVPATETSAAETASAPSPTPAPPEPARPATLTVSAVGDMIFDRKVKTLVQNSGGDAPLAAVASHLAAADVAVGNLESNLATSGTRNTAKDVTFQGTPKAISGLQLAGFDLLSMANNHVLDYGAQSLLDTISLLDSVGIAHAGAGANQAAAWTPATVTRKDATVAYLAFSHIVPAGFIAQEDRAGMASGKTDMGRTMAAIAEAKQTHDYVIVSFHWGVEYEDNANAEQVKWAHAAVDAGADMVAAHHPHVIQGIETYNGRLIAYSLGDFVFDHYSRKTGEAFILDAEMGPDGIANAHIVPVYLDGNGAPEIVTGSEASAILTRLQTISARHGTRIEITGDTARIAQ